MMTIASIDGTLEPIQAEFGADALASVQTGVAVETALPQRGQVAPETVEAFRSALTEALAENATISDELKTALVSIAPQMTPSPRETTSVSAAAAGTDPVAATSQLRGRGGSPRQNEEVSTLDLPRLEEEVSTLDSTRRAAASTEDRAVAAISQTTVETVAQLRGRGGSPRQNEEVSTLDSTRLEEEVATLDSTRRAAASTGDRAVAAISQTTVETVAQLRGRGGSPRQNEEVSTLDTPRQEEEIATLDSTRRAAASTEDRAVAAISQATEETGPVAGDDLPSSEVLVAAGVGSAAYPSVAGVETVENPVAVSAVDVVRAQATAAAAPLSPAEVLVQAAEAVADTLLVSPGLLRGQGEVVIRLRPDVLEGTEVRLAVTGRQLEIVFQPQSVDMAVMIENCRTQIVNHLAAKIATFNVTVDVRKKKA